MQFNEKEIKIEKEILGLLPVKKKINVMNILRGVRTDLH